jgi:hypothetical protein
MHRFTHIHDPLDGPPAHVLAEVDAAWERSQDLVAGELELHFAQALMGGHVTGELRLPGGGDLIERVSATEALALACGDVALALAA